MKKSYLYAAWGVLYALCVGLGFVEKAAGFGKFLLVLVGILFFLPPFWLLWQAKKEANRKTLKALRFVSIGFLALSLILLVANFLSVYLSAETGLVLYVLLVMFSVPMVCIQYWALGLFLWACLLFATLPAQRPCQK